jgi:hypothetical protein
MSIQKLKNGKFRDSKTGLVLKDGKTLTAETKKNKNMKK